VLALLKGLFGFLSRFADWLRNKQQQDAGRALERVEAQKEVIDNVKRANEALNAEPDPARDKRLRNRFDRSRTGDSQ
jgi:hypothetical protein